MLSHTKPKGSSETSLVLLFETLTFVFVMLKEIELSLIIILMEDAWEITFLCHIPHNVHMSRQLMNLFHYMLVMCITCHVMWYTNMIQKCGLPSVTQI